MEKGRKAERDKAGVIGVREGSRTREFIAEKVNEFKAAASRRSCVRSVKDNDIIWMFESITRRN